MIQRSLIGFHYLFQLLTDWDILRAVLLAFSAFYAERSIALFFFYGSAHNVLLKPLPVSVQSSGIEAPEGSGDIHSGRTGHTITAAGAAYFYFPVNGLYHLGECFIFEITTFIKWIKERLRVE